MTRKFLKAFPGICTIFGAALLVSGCGLHQSPEKPVAYYQLNYEAPAPCISGASLPFVICVDSFQSMDLYSRQSIVYQDSPHKTGRYAYHQWIAPLDRMLPNLIARDLRKADIVRGVFVEGGEAMTHRLLGSIEEFYEADAPDHWTAVAAVTITFIDARHTNAAEQIVFQKTYSTRRPCAEKTPAAFVEAASQAMAGISKELTGDIYEALEKEEN